MVMAADNRPMLQSVHQAGAVLLNALPDFFVDECKYDSARIVIPEAHVQVAVRFGSHLPGGFDVHAMGPRHKVHRKSIRGGQRTVCVRLPLGTCHAVLGEPASEFAGRIVALGELWNTAATQRLEEQLAAARDADAAVVSLKASIAERLEPRACSNTSARLVQSAARRLQSHNVASVAKDLGVSERHLRRVFHEMVGLSPKAIFKLMRFQRALRAAQGGRNRAWSDIAVGAGYYDQAHLIADFRSIAGATPREFLAESVCRDSIPSKTMIASVL